VTSQHLDTHSIIRVSDIVHRVEITSALLITS